MKRTLLLTAIAVVGCQQAPVPPPARVPAAAPADTATASPLPPFAPRQVWLGVDFTDWPRATDSPYHVGRSFMTFCRPLTPEEVRQLDAHKAEHGPHNADAIVVRVSPTAVEAFKGARPVPAGTVVVKEKHNSTAAESSVAVAMMTKREPGYDPAGGDWEYAYQERNGQPARGKIETCATCHKAARDTDYLFRPYLGVTK